MGAKGVWVADAMGHRQEVTIVLACEASRDKSARLRPRLDDEYCVGEPNHEAVAGGEVMDVRARVRWVLAQHPATFFQNIFSEAAIAPRIDSLIVKPRARQGEGVEPGRERRLVGAGVHAERKPRHYRDRVACEACNQYLACLLPVTRHRPAPDHYEELVPGRWHQAAHPQPLGRLRYLVQPLPPFFFGPLLLSQLAYLHSPRVY